MMDNAASIRAKLLKIAKQEDIQFQRIVARPNKDIELLGADNKQKQTKEESGVTSSLTLVPPEHGSKSIWDLAM